MKRKLNIGILALVAVFVLSGCNTASDQPDKFRFFFSLHEKTT